jgi:Skp family chaperone for outer membrane proteins
MIQDKNYAEEEVAEDLLDLIKEYEAEIKKLKERETALLKSLQASLGESPAALIEEYIEVKIDRSLRLFELDLRTRYADEEAATSKAVDRIFKEYG